MLGRQQEFNLKIIQIIDSVLLALTFWAAHALRTHGTHVFGWTPIPIVEQFYWQFLLIVPFTPLVLERFGFYTHPAQKTTVRSLTQLCQGLLIIVLLTSVAVTFVQKATVVSRAVVLLFPLLAIPALMVREMLVKQWLRKETAKGRLRQRVGVHPHEERTLDPVRLPIQANGLRDRKNVRLIEGARERRTAVSRRSECDTFRRDTVIRVLRVVRGHQPRDVDQQRGWSWRSSKRADLHHP